MYSRKKHNILIGTWVVTIVFFIVTTILNVLARVSTDTVVFKTNVTEMLAGASLDMKPAPWVQWFWVVVIVWQATWLIYFGIALCRKGIDQEPLIVSPVLLSTQTILLTVLTNCLNIAGLFLWDRDIWIGGVSCTGFMAFFMWISVVFACSQLSANQELLERNNMGKEVWFVRSTLLNGLAIYAAHSTVVFFIQLNAVITREHPDTSKTDSTTIFFSILTFFFVLYFICDLTLLDTWLRYVLTPYFSVIYVLASIVAGNWGKIWLRDYRNPAYISSVLGVAIIFAITKIVLAVGRRPGFARKGSTMADKDPLVDYDV